jgi:hypothetical protein
VALSVEKLYRAHVKNLGSVTAGIQRIERELRSAISRKDDASTKALLNILLLLTGSWAECRLRKLLYEPNGFDDAHRSYILGGRSQIDQWHRSIETGFRRRYGIAHAQLPSPLPPTARMLYNELFSAINLDLKPIIEMRNTLAHGQWARPFNSSGDDIVSSMLAALNQENALSARFKATILECLASVIHDLVSGNHAFERDFDLHFSRLENARRNLQKRDYSAWRANMIAKFEVGRVRRNAALQSIAPPN